MAGKNVTKRKPAANGEAKKSVDFAAGTKAAAVPKGVVAAATKKPAQKKKAAPAKTEEVSESESEGDDDESVNSDDLSSEDGEDRIMALEFRFLPSQFQEPELRLYLSQFGSKVSKA
eukprot:357775_1